MEIPWYIWVIGGVVGIAVLAYMGRKTIARAILFRRK